MAHELKLVLTEQEYSAIATEAANNGKQPEALIHEIVTEWYHLPRGNGQMPERIVAEKLYHEGKLAQLATRQSLPQQEKEQRERFIQKLARTNDKTASEMVIEDRGPY